MANRKPPNKSLSREQILEANRANQNTQEKEDELDEALRGTFPASDPVALSQPTAATPSLADRPHAKAGDHTRMEIVDAAPNRVDVSNQDDIRYWTERLGVSEDELKEAVRQAGFFPAEVADYLGKTL